MKRHLSTEIQRDLNAALAQAKVFVGLLQQIFSAPPKLLAAPDKSVESSMAAAGNKTNPKPKE